MKYMVRILAAAVIILTANFPVLLDSPDIGFQWLFLLLPCFLIINIIPSYSNRKLPLKRLRLCADGCELLILFLISAAVTAVCLLSSIAGFFPERAVLWITGLLSAVIVESVIFWNGIIRVYGTSFQIGLKWRVIGVICGWIPVIHLIVLWKIIGIALEEVAFESGKIHLNREREGKEICRTRYPILMVHGVFFRDFKYFNYWGRIPKELERNGAAIFYGNHQSAASVADSGEELAKRIVKVIEETGSEKLNLIAHSKGGLDCRYAISLLSMDRYVASLTTINTPHRGCLFAEYLLNKIPSGVKEQAARSYNAALRKLGDPNPDFLAAIWDLTASACRSFNEAVSDSPGVYYRSIGSKLNVASGGRFPLNFSHQLVKYFDGPNDGLVSEDSFQWGSEYTFLTTKGRRGISHGDMIDLNRENIKEFDVREFYVGIVHDLKEKGF